MMDAEDHPHWCNRAACTAYGTGRDGLHRSDPHVIATSDPVISVIVYKGADQDGAGEFIELAEVTLSETQPWHLTEPIMERTLTFPRAAAEAIRHALTELV